MQTNRVISVFGDSILKGVRLLSGTTRYGTTDDIGLESIAKQHDWTLQNCSRFGCTIRKGELLLNRQRGEHRLDAVRAQRFDHAAQRFDKERQRRVRLMLVIRALGDLRPAEIGVVAAVLQKNDRGRFALFELAVQKLFAFLHRAAEA